MLPRSSGRFFGPALCFSTSEKCRLTCEGNAREAEPISYGWRRGGGEWERSTKHLSITKKNSSHIPTFSCRMEKVRHPLTNLFFTEPCSTVVAHMLRVSLLGASWGIIGCLAWRKWDVLRDRTALMFQAPPSSRDFLQYFCRSDALFLVLQFSIM